MSNLHDTLKLIDLGKKKNMDYLELGYFPIENRGNNFENVDGFNTKTSVDMDTPLASYHMTTDDFFNINTSFYDIIYIDAGHICEQVVKDYNNSVCALKENGVIFIHDVYPPNISMTIPGYCGDGFKLLNYFIDNDFDYYSYIPDMGLTFILNPKIVNTENISDIDYSVFQNKQGKFSHDLLEWQNKFINKLQ